jgi:protein gp37
MGSETLISWTDHTANPWMGCSKLSPGCANCYAAFLVVKRKKLKVWGPKAPRHITKTIWRDIPKWQKAAEAGAKGVLGSDQHLVFVGSLCDWAEDRPELIAPREKLWEAIRSSPNLIFQLLTKRPQNIRRFLPPDWGEEGYPNVWLGTSIENMEVAERANHLRTVPAVVRFVSYEPALGPLNNFDLTGIDWLICGGESGSGFRPMSMSWARDIRTQCERAGVAFFFKQKPAFKSGSGAELDGRAIHEFPTPRQVNSLKGGNNESI